MREAVLEIHVEDQPTVSTPAGARPRPGRRGDRSSTGSRVRSGRARRTAPSRRRRTDPTRGRTARRSTARSWRAEPLKLACRSVTDGLPYCTRFSTSWRAWLKHADRLALVDRRILRGAEREPEVVERDAHHDRQNPEIHQGIPGRAPERVAQHGQGQQDEQRAGGAVASEHVEPARRSPRAGGRRTSRWPRASPPPASRSTARRCPRAGSARKPIR